MTACIPVLNETGMTRFRVTDAHQHHFFDTNRLQAKGRRRRCQSLGITRLAADRAQSDARRLVLGAAVGMSVAQVHVFVTSLRQAGYTGAVVILTGLADRRLATYLSTHGVEPRRVWFVRRWHGPIHAYRFELFARYLRQFGGRYDEVLISDVRDVAFQAYPFVGAMGSGCHFFLEGASKTIGNEPTNALYMRLFLAPAEFEAIAAERISCCGVLLGGIPAVTAYLERMTARLAAVPLRVRRKIGADTAFHNLIARAPGDLPSVIVENNVLVATMGIEAATRYVVDADGRVRTSDGRLPAILHQYDRIPEICAPVEARFAR